MTLSVAWEVVEPLSRGRPCKYSSVELCQVAWLGAGGVTGAELLDYPHATSSHSRFGSQSFWVTGMAGVVGFWAAFTSPLGFLQGKEALAPLTALMFCGPQGCFRQGPRFARGQVFRAPTAEEMVCLGWGPCRLQESHCSAECCRVHSCPHWILTRGC